METHVGLLMQPQHPAGHLWGCPHGEDACLICPAELDKDSLAFIGYWRYMVPYVWLYDDYVDNSQRMCMLRRCAFLHCTTTGLVLKLQVQQKGKVTTSLVPETSSWVRPHPDWTNRSTSLQNEQALLGPVLGVREKLAVSVHRHKWCNSPWPYQSVTPCILVAGGQPPLGRDPLLAACGMGARVSQEPGATLALGLRGWSCLSGHTACLSHSPLGRAKFNACASQ